MRSKHPAYWSRLTQSVSQPGGTEAGWDIAAISRALRPSRPQVAGGARPLCPAGCSQPTQSGPEALGSSTGCREGEGGGGGGGGLAWRGAWGLDAKYRAGPVVACGVLQHSSWRSSRLPPSQTASADASKTKGIAAKSVTECLWATAVPVGAGGQGQGTSRRQKKIDTPRAKIKNKTDWSLKKPRAPTALRGSIYKGYIEHRAQSTEHRAQSNADADMPIAQYICKQAGGRR
jgi:hypothetical protein